MFSLGSDHFSSGLSGSLSLSSHGSHQLLGNPDVLHLHPLHQDSPGIRGLIKTRLIQIIILDKILKLLHLHFLRYGLSLGENVTEVSGSQDISDKIR